MSQDQEPNPPQSFNELIGLTMQLNSRIDTLWQRVVYAHAAIVGVMVFFASSPDPFVLARVLVILFYTMNSIVTYVAFRDTYKGLCAAVEDLKATGQAKGQVFAWIEGHNFHLHSLRRAFILAVLWCIITYLILGELLGLY